VEPWLYILEKICDVTFFSFNVKVLVKISVPLFLYNKEVLLKPYNNSHFVGEWGYTFIILL